MTSIAIICIMYKWNCTIWGHQTQKHPLKGFSTASRGFVFFQASLPPLPAETFGKTWCNGLISASAGTEAVRLGSEMTMMKLNQGLLGSFPKTACELLGCLLLTLYTWDVFHILWYKCSSCFLVAPAFLHNQNAPWHLDDFVDGIQDFSQTHETLLSESFKESVSPIWPLLIGHLQLGGSNLAPHSLAPNPPEFPFRSLWIWRHTRARKRSASSFDMAVDSHLNNSTCPLRDNLRLSQRLQHTTVYGAHIVSPLGARNQSDQKDVEKVIAATSRPRFEFCF